MRYQVKTPWWLSHLVYSRLTWKMPAGIAPAVYLTFDDGPHETATKFALDILQQYDAKATFFCIGKNVVAHPGIYSDILAAGHTAGNHTHNHLNGWKHTDMQYLDNIQLASGYIDSKLFRPPYGRIKRSQATHLLNAGWNICMWDVLSGDFDRSLSPGKCLDNVLRHTEPGSIVLFHDSEKAWERMSYALPRVLEYCKEKNWQLKALPQS